MHRIEAAALKGAEQISVKSMKNPPTNTRELWQGVENKKWARSSNG
jgi:hypothetical protein